MRLSPGDVIICRQGRQAKCAFGVVRSDDSMPTEWMTGSLREARIWAIKHTVETGGERREFDEIKAPGSARPRRAARRNRRGR